MNEELARAEYAEMLPCIETFRAVLVANIKRVTAIESIRTRIKSWDSVRAELQRGSAASVADVSDFLGIRVVVPSDDALLRASIALTNELRSSPTDSLLRVGDAATHLIVKQGSGGVGRAEVLILTAAEEARRALLHELNYKFESSATNTHPLDVVIATFEALIANPTVHEKRDIHPFINKHKFLLFPNPDAITSEIAIGLGTRHRIDFLVRRADNTYILVEIENPRRPIVNADGDFSRHVNHALCQVEDWQDWIESNLPVVEKEYPGMAAPEAWVIIGRGASLDTPARRRMARRNINMRGRVMLRTYDDLVRDAKAYVKGIASALAAN